MGGLFSEASLQGIFSNNDLKSSQPSIDISIGGLLSEASLQGKLNYNEVALDGKNIVDHHQQSPVPIAWDDNLTTLSIGGLLSEASLQAKINNNNNKNKAGDGFISDSLDAINVSSHVKTNCSSILDAEETCHAFAFRKFSSSTKNVRVTAMSTQDSISNPFKYPHFPEVRLLLTVEILFQFEVPNKFLIFVCSSSRFKDKLKILAAQNQKRNFSFVLNHMVKTAEALG